MYYLKKMTLSAVIDDKLVTTASPTARKTSKTNDNCDTLP